MTAAIKPGDLVMVVLPSVCCGRTDSIGNVGIVQLNPSWATYAQCDVCGRTDRNTHMYRTIEGGGYHIDTLKRIDPPALADENEAEQELEAV